MKLLLKLFIFSFLITSCQEQIEVNTSNSLGDKKDEIIPVITSLVATQENITLRGKDLDGVTGARFTFEKKAPVKEFKIISREFGKLVIESIDLTPLPVDIALTLILDNAFGQHKFPVLFSLQDDAVRTRHIMDGNVTRLKLGKEEQDEPNNGDVLKWDDSTGTFIFAPDNTGVSGGDGTVTNIGLGNGIVGDGDAITTTGDISVDVGVSGHPSLTKIPYFNSKNQLVLDNKDSTSNPTKLLFSDGNTFSMYSDGSLLINNESDGQTLLRIGPKGEVVIPQNLTVAGQRVCLQDGTDCPTPQTNPGGIETITTTHPVLGGGSDPSVNISIDVGTGAGQVVQLDENGALPTVDGTNLIGVVKGPATSQYGSAAFFGGNKGETIKGTDYRIPEGDGKLGEVLMTDGTGNVTWQGVGIGNGDVIGPDSSGRENIATYDGTTGKRIKDSGVKISDLGDVKGSKVSAVNAIAIYSDNSGKAIKSTPYSIPDKDGDLGQVLANDGNGKAVWATIPSGGDVTGPESAKTTAIALFSDGTGKKIAGTFYGMPVLDGRPGQVIATDGNGRARWTTIQSGSGGDVTGPDGAITGNIPSYNDTTGKIINDSGVAAQLVLDNQTNIASIQGTLTDFDTRISSNETNFTNLATEVASHLQVPDDSGKSGRILTSRGDNKSTWIPNGNEGQVLTSNALGGVSWRNIPAGGDVTGPNSSTLGNIASYNDATGKLIKDSGVAANLVLDNQTNIISLQASNTEFNNRITNNETNITNLQTEVASHLQVPTDAGNAGRILTSSGDDKSSWLSDGANGEVLTTDGAGVVSWQSIAGGGDVTGPASSTDFNLAAFDGVTGKLIRDGGVNVNELLKSNVTSDATNKIAVYSDMAGKNLVEGFLVPPTQGMDGQVLTADGGGGTHWVFQGPYGDVEGPNSSVDSNIALFDGTNGKLIKDSGKSINDFGDVKGPDSSIAGNVAAYDDVTGKLINDSGIPAQLILDNQTNIGGIQATLTDFDLRITTNETNITNLQTEVASHLEVPSDGGNGGRILTSSGDDNSAWLSNGIDGQVLTTNALGTVSWQDVPAGGDVNGPLTSVVNQVALYDGTTGKLIKKTDYTLPVADGNSGEVLTSDGNGSVSFQPAAPGGGFGGIKICEIEIRLGKGKEIAIPSGKNDVRWDAAGPYGADCSWISYGSTTNNGDYKSENYFSEINLPAGNYMVDAWVSFQKCGQSWVELYNQTDGNQIRMGGTGNASKDYDIPTHYAVKSSFSLGGQKALKMRFSAQESDCRTSKGDIEENPHELSGQMVIWKFN